MEKHEKEIQITHPEITTVMLYLQYVHPVFLHINFMHTSIKKGDIMLYVSCELIFPSYLTLFISPLIIPCSVTPSRFAIIYLLGS